MSLECFRSAGLTGKSCTQTLGQKTGSSPRVLMLNVLKGGKHFFFRVLFAEAACCPHLAAVVLELGVAMGMWGGGGGEERGHWATYEDRE